MSFIALRQHLSVRVLCALFTLLAVPRPAGAQAARQASAPSPSRFADLAHRIIATSAAVKPGDAVVINGGKHTIPLMEALAIEVQKAGGFPNLLLSSDSVTRSFYRDVPASASSWSPATSRAGSVPRRYGSPCPPRRTFPP
jgi:hypothetical protein